MVSQSVRCIGRATVLAVSAASLIALRVPSGRRVAVGRRVLAPAVTALAGIPLHKTTGA